MSKLFKIIFLSLTLTWSLTSTVFGQQSDFNNTLPFKNYWEIKKIRNEISPTLYLIKDRTKAPYFHNLGSVLYMVNADISEEQRNFQEQVELDIYGRLLVTEIIITNFNKLNDLEKDELLKTYDQEEIAMAHNIVSILKVKFFK